MLRTTAIKKTTETWQTTMHQKTDIHHMQMNRTETVKTAEIQIRQHRKTAIETARIPAKT